MSVVASTKHNYTGVSEKQVGKSPSSSISLSSSEGASMATNIEQNSRIAKNQLPRSASLAKELSNETDIMAWIDPIPAKPPSYKVCNANRRIRFPVYEQESDGILPAYSPGVEAITVISMKAEWLSPYEHSPSRGWKNFIMELNSTQVNFYCIDPSLTRNIRNYCNGRAHFGGEVIEPALEYDAHQSFFSSLGSKSTYQFNKQDQEWITNKVRSDAKKYLTDDRLFKSFSLQFAKFGIPTDYNRKTFVLRLRCEMEQFLLNFSHVDDMIMWSVYFSIGIGISLDLDFRELPSYRTVPRRRRRRRRKRQNGTSHAGEISGFRRSPVGTPIERPILHQKLSSGILGLNSKGTKSSKSSGCSSNSRRGSDGSIKSKLKSFFGSDKKSPRPVLRYAHSRTQSVRALNAVTEDDENEESPSPFSASSSPKKSAKTFERPALEQRSKSMGTQENGKVAGDYFSMVPPSYHDDTPSGACSPISPCSDMLHGTEAAPSGGLQKQVGYHNNIALQRELEELQQVIMEHNETEEDVQPDYAANDNDDDDDDDDDDIRDDEEEDDGREDEVEDVDSIRRSAGGAASSIYQEEGIFHDSEDDFIYVIDRNDEYRRRASSVTSNLSSTPYGSDGVKWRPSRKEMSRRRYIRDSLRCIKPFSDEEEWLGKVAVRPVSPPTFTTINVPFALFAVGPGKGTHLIAPKTSKTKNGEKPDWTKCKNHFVKAYIVGPVGLLKARARI
ncbi:LAMI_0B01112g1_1 [Lachancea mirantina]|uniref:LAMI_0B01112g1_1 n=1 Tax=Lachancea mirantina TaxID=1230905 RepID=A0A1G4ITH3_9SACH|nr:LAMI_0B01112g1_1 [Lachancea mirantina]